MNYVHVRTPAKRPHTHLPGVPLTTEGDRYRAMCGVLGDLVEQSEHPMCKSCLKKAEKVSGFRQTPAKPEQEPAPTPPDKINNLWELP